MGNILKKIVFRQQNVIPFFPIEIDSMELESDENFLFFNFSRYRTYVTVHA